MLLTPPVEASSSSDAEEEFLQGGIGHGHQPELDAGEGEGATTALVESFLEEADDQWKDTQTTANVTSTAAAGRSTIASAADKYTVKPSAKTLL